MFFKIIRSALLYSRNAACESDEKMKWSIIGVELKTSINFQSIGYQAFVSLSMISCNPSVDG